jgi:hypothetical protein
VIGRAEEFHEGMAVLAVQNGDAASSENALYGYINRPGEVVIQPRFTKALHFSEGLAAVRTRNKTDKETDDMWGYIDNTGKYRIKPIFNEVYPFAGGVAIVHLGGKRMVAPHLPPTWEGGEWWLINRTGKKLRTPW